MSDFLPVEIAHWLIQASYFLAAILFIWGLKKMSHPRTARGGVIWAGVGMVANPLPAWATRPRTAESLCWAHPP